jgi:hypothetical protein
VTLPRASPVFKPISARGHRYGALPEPPQAAPIPVFKPDPVEGDHVPFGHHHEPCWLKRSALSTATEGQGAVLALPLCLEGLVFSPASGCRSSALPKPLGPGLSASA